MSKIVKQVVEFKCDICGQLCDESERVIDKVINYGLYGDQPTRLIGQFKVYVPYGTTDGHVCRSCLKKHLKEWIER